MCASLGWENDACMSLRVLLPPWQRLLPDLLFKSLCMNAQDKARPGVVTPYTCLWSNFGQIDAGQALKGACCAGAARMLRAQMHEVYGHTYA